MNHKLKRIRLVNSKKAISPILATLLLIVIADAAIVMTYAWITTYMGTATAQAEVMPYKANVNFKGNDTITIDIGNSGTAKSEIIQVYVGTSSSTLQNQKTDPTSPIALNAGSIASFDVSYTWTAGDTYYFKVVTASGTPLSFTEQAPQ
jgi:flagellin-like protein